MTFIDMENPVAIAGTLTSAELWFNAIVGTATGVKVATFSKDGSTFTPRSVSSIGNVTAGSKQTKAVNLAAVIGDYIGFYVLNGYIEADSTGGAAYWSAAGDQTGGPAAFTEYAGRIVSIYATGTGPTIVQGEAAISAGSSVAPNADLYLGGIVPITAAASVLPRGSGIFSEAAALIAAFGVVADWRTPEWGTTDIAVSVSLAAQSLKITKGQMTTTVSASLAPLATSYLSQLFGYTGTLSPGDTLVIDCDAKTIELNGVNVVRYMTGKFPQLYSGTNELRWKDAGATRTIALDEDHDPRFL
jgi:hypothetical protein